MSVSGAELVYWVGDEQITLESLDHFAVLKRRETGGPGLVAFERAISNNAAFELQRRPAIEREFGLYLVKKRGNVSERDFLKAQRNTGSQHPGASFRVGDFAMVATGKFYVDLTESASNMEEPGSRMFSALIGIESSCRYSGEPPRIEPLGRNRYAVEFTFDDEATQWPLALAAMNCLRKEEAFGAAFPDFIPIRLYPLTTSMLAQCPDLPAASPPNDEKFGSQWSLNNPGRPAPHNWVAGADIKAKEAWAESTGLADVVIAVIDAGVKIDHKDLEAKIDEPIIQAGPSTAVPEHGTTVAGVAGAESNNGNGVAGVSWESRVLPVIVFDSGALPGEQAAAIIQAGFRAEVLVVSWSMASDTQLRDAFRALIDDLGRVVVVAAGNFNTADCSIPSNCPWQMTFPTTEEGVISVSWTNPIDQFKTFKNYLGYTPNSDGGDLGWGSRHGSLVDTTIPWPTLSAPGDTIWTTSAGPTEYTCPNGTSLSAPLVAGGAALLRSVYPSATPSQIAHWITTSADKGASQSVQPDPFYGWGRLNLNRAFEAAAAAPPIANSTSIRTNPTRGSCVTFDANPWLQDLRGPSLVSGNLVYEEDRILVTARSFQSGTTPMFGSLTRNSQWWATPDFSADLKDMSLAFDFSDLSRIPHQVTARFEDLGALENISVNGSVPIVGELESGTIPGVSWSVVRVPPGQGDDGMLVVNGHIQSLTLGGNNLRLDSICTDVPPADHLAIYHFRPVAKGRQVVLQSQFEPREKRAAQVIRAVSLGVPVSKNEEGISRATASLTFYEITETPQPDRVLQITNQFGRQTLTIGKANLLAMPSSAKEQFRNHLDHYKCFVASGGKPKAGSLRLIDQFGDSNKRLGKPVYFCAPTRISVDKAVVPIRNHLTHYTIYELDDIRGMTPASHTTTVWNRFGKYDLSISNPDYLAVPSTKLATGFKIARP